jgi:hypothetical protein
LSTPKVADFGRASQPHRTKGLGCRPGYLWCPYPAILQQVALEPLGQVRALLDIRMGEALEAGLTAGAVRSI